MDKKTIESLTESFRVTLDVDGDGILNKVLYQQQQQQQQQLLLLLLLLLKYNYYDILEGLFTKVPAK